MNLHEYQAKEILARYDLEIPPFGVVSSPDQVRPLIDKLHLKEAV
ncbi:MAG: ATP-grasp domain, partial [Chlamydiota bacterium]